jgi:hypothetical protein
MVDDETIVVVVRGSTAHVHNSLFATPAVSRVTLLELAIPTIGNHSSHFTSQ